MHALFNFQNWRDFYQEDGFSLVLGGLLLGVFAVLAILFSDNLKRWRADAREKAKWSYWNRE